MNLRPAMSFVKNKFRDSELVGAEIGVQKGTHAQSIIDNLKMSKLILIDLWEEYEQQGVVESSASLYKDVLEKFQGAKNVEIIKKPSIDAYCLFPDKCFDFVYIDACHTFEALSQDLKIWYPKIKCGGVLCGHDFSDSLWPGVVKAILEFSDKKSLGLHSRLTEENTQSDWWTVKK